MYLEKIEVQGFKSFAEKNKLVFPGFIQGDKRGITAIVGPNGSGKSNIADAVRWALGEQSMKNLRAKAGEDVIFFGSKNKQNLAEVSLYLNNESKTVNIPYSQLVITRRIFRNGENEYLINGSKAKLLEIQMLLAKSNVGQKTYSVIGQGMVESFLKTTPAERKDFFDEATGIKELQIKRENSLNKLVNSHKNLEQAKMIVDEIEPRLKSLTRQVNKLHKKGVLERELEQIQTQYFQAKWHLFNDKFISSKEEYQKIELQKNKKEQELSQKNLEFNKIQEKKGLGEEFNQWSVAITKLQQEREAIIKKISSLEAQREIKLEQVGRFDLSWLESQKKELKTQVEQKEQELEKTNQELKTKEQRFNQFKNEKQIASQEKEKLNNQLFELMPSSRQEKDLNKQTEEQLKNINQLLVEIEKEKEISAIKKGLFKLKEKITLFAKLISGQKQEEEEKGSQKKQAFLQESLKKSQAKLDLVEEKQNKAWFEFNHLQERSKNLELEITKIKQDLINIEAKINKNSQKIDKQKLLEDIEKQEKNQKQELEKIDKQIKTAREKFNYLTSEEEERKTSLSKLQQESQFLQKEISELNNLLNELKTNFAKYETKIEDLEKEIEFNQIKNLEKIKQEKPSTYLNLEIAIEKIEKIKNQLNLIGAIDPETEKEYYQAKEKYEFLTEQIADLKKGIHGLESIIKELDETIKQRFDKEFKKIAQKFEQYFKIIFGGGTAKILKVPYQNQDWEEKEIKEENNERIKNLTKNTSTGVAGIDIQVNPPDKKITSLSMLSGGEKALTAIALICAIISSNPSPFVVLDEIDAALDEANSDRLAQVLEDLAHKTQFILITHNRASMHKANVLYGTTMNEKGISKLLSIKLEEVVSVLNK